MGLPRLLLAFRRYRIAVAGASPHPPGSCQGRTRISCPRTRTPGRKRPRLAALSLWGRTSVCPPLSFALCRGGLQSALSSPSCPPSSRPQRRDLLHSAWGRDISCPTLPHRRDGACPALSFALVVAGL